MRFNDPAGSSRSVACWQTRAWNHHPGRSRVCPRLARSASGSFHAAYSMALHPARVSRSHLTAIALLVLRCEHGLWTKMNTDQWVERMDGLCNRAVSRCRWRRGVASPLARSLASSAMHGTAPRTRHARRARTPASWGWKSMVLPTSQSNKRGALSRPDPNAPNIHAGLCSSLRTQPASHPRATLRLFR